MGHGHLVGTPGDVTDYEPVKAEIRNACERFQVERLGFDRWNALQIANDLIGEGIPMVEVPQNTGGMYPGAKLLERLVYARKLRHGGQPVLRYCADNTALLYDSNDNFRPDKRRSRANGRIDGIVAACMAGSMAMFVDPTTVIDVDYELA